MTTAENPGLAPASEEAVLRKRKWPLYILTQKVNDNDLEKFPFKTTCPHEWFAEDEIKIELGFQGREMGSVATIIINSVGRDDLRRMILFSITPDALILSDHEGAVEVGIPRCGPQKFLVLNPTRANAWTVLTLARMEHLVGSDEEIFQKHLARAPVSSEFVTPERALEAYEAIVDFAPFLP